ncbi:MAG: hypothetical protein AB6733_13035 [Clostridiaceae bacterium]
MESNFTSIFIAIVNSGMAIVGIIIFIKLFNFLNNYKKDLAILNSKLDEVLKKLK